MSIWFVADGVPGDREYRGCKEPPASQIARCTEGIFLPGSAPRAPCPSRATALSDGLSSHVPLQPTTI